MSIDLIMGVVQAADKAKMQRAETRLAAMDGAGPGLFRKIVAAFGKPPVGTRVAAEMGDMPKRAVSAESIGEDLLADVMAAANPERKLHAQTKLERLSGDGAVVANLEADKDKPRAAMQKLEGALLSAVTDQILPKTSSTLYGGGTAGEMARQFQAEQLAETSAEAEPLGLAKRFYGEAEIDATPELQNSSQWPYFGRRTITPYAA
jgi:hypothetical protein